jgi:hypothetical protein
MSRLPHDRDPTPGRDSPSRSVDAGNEATDNPSLPALAGGQPIKDAACML